MGAQHRSRRPGGRRTAAVTTGVLLATAVSGCSLFGGGSGPGRDVSVFKLKPGDCLLPQTAVKEQLSDVQVVPCNEPHTQEAYAIVRYDRPASATSSGATAADPNAYPGAGVLKQFADGACAQHYGSYVGIDYPDSSLFFTYLLPSARGWQQKDDRSVVCFVTTAGASLTSSVKGSRR